MWKRTLLVALVVLGGWASPAAQAQTLVARLKSIDAFFADAGYLAELANRDEEAKQVQALVQTLISKDTGLAGIDTSKPVGIYGLVSANMDDNALVAMIPIANEKTFLENLERFNQRFKKGEDGIYSGNADPYPIEYHFRFANGYAYVAFPGKAALATSKLRKPGDLFSQSDASLLSATLNVDQIPDEFKQIALGQIDLRFAAEMDKENEKETDEEKALRLAALKETARHVSMLIKDGGALSFKLNIDRQNQAIVTDFSVAGKKGSELATDLSALGKRTTPLAILLEPGSAMNGMIHFALPETVRAALAPVIDDEIKKAIEKEPTPEEREKGGIFLEALKPTLKSGELDMGFRVEGPDAQKKYSFLGGVKIQKGQDIDETLRELVKILPKREQNMIHFAALKSPKGVIHRIDAQKRFEEDTKKVLGENPLFVAILPDMAWLAGGPNAEALITRATTAKAGAAPQFTFSMSVARLVPTMNRDKLQEISQIADRVFASGKDRIGVTISGGESFRIRSTVDASVVRFFATLAQRKIDPFDRDPTTRQAIKDEKKDEEKE